MSREPLSDTATVARLVLHWRCLFDIWVQPSQLIKRIILYLYKQKHFVVLSIYISTFSFIFCFKAKIKIKNFIIIKLKVLFEQFKHTFRGIVVCWLINLKNIQSWSKNRTKFYFKNECLHSSTRPCQVFSQSFLWVLAAVWNRLNNRFESTCTFYKSINLEWEN